MKEKLKQNKRLVALVTLIVMIVNMFSPYCTLISYASVDTSKPFLELANGYDENDPDFGEIIQPDYEDFNVIPVRLYLGGFETVNGLDINFSYDSELLTPVYYKRNKYVNATAIGEAFDSAGNVSLVESGNVCSYLFTNESRIRFQATPTIQTGLNPNGKVLLGTFYFQISDGYTLEDITSEAFKLVKGASGLQDGLEIDYNNVTQWVMGENYFEVSGFESNGEVEVTSFEVTNPSNLNYEHGDTINFTGSVVTIKYSDNSTYSESLSKAISDGKVTLDRSTADVNNPSFTATSVEDTTKSKTINLTVTDPVSSIRLISSPSTTSYNTGDTINLTGGVLEVKTKSGVTNNINLPDSSVTSDTTLADINSLNIQGNKWTTTSGLVAGNQKVTLTYTDSYGVTKNTSFTITVNDSISGITIKTNPSKTTYKYGDSLDLTGGKITVSTVGGSSFDLNMEDGSVNVTGYNGTPTSFPNNQNLNVTYSGKTAPTTIPVTVKNYVKEILLTNPTKTIYKYGDSIDLTGGSYNIKYGNGATDRAVSLTAADLSGYSMNTIGSQVVTVSYTDNNADSYTFGEVFTKTFTIQINDYISKIEITNPTDVSFYYGDTFTFNGGKIEAYYASAPTTAVEIPMTSTMIRQADGNSVVMSPASNLFDNTTQKYQEQLEISVTRGGITETSNYNIEIINTVTGIAIQGTPQTDYNVNDPLQTGLSILVTREVGEPEAVTVTSDMISNFDTTTEGTRTATITYTENGVTKTTTYEYTVTDSVKSISIQTAPKEAQKYGEELDLTGAKISVVKGSKTTTENITQSMIKPGTYDKNTLGEQTVTVVYGGKEATFKVKVKDYVTGIKLNPSNVTGKYNDELSSLISKNNIQYTVTYAKAGDTTPVTLTESMVSGYNKSTTASQSLTVTYKDSDANSYTKEDSFTTTLGVALSNTVKSIAITAPSKTEYKHGESIATNGTITVTFADNTTQTRLMTASMITESDGSTLNMSPSSYDNTNKVSKTLKITYTEDGKTENINYPITIVNDVQSISMHSTPKTNYNVNDTLDLTVDGTNYGEILVTRAVGDPEPISLNDAKVKVTGFSSASENTKLPLTVSYTENGVTKTTQYNVVIKDTVTGISLKTAPKQNYKYNEELDVTGGYITVTKGSGSTDVAITSSMVSGYNKGTLGEQELTITYGGQTVKYKVNVKDYVTGIKVNPSNVTGKYNDELSSLISKNNIKYTVTYAKAGDTTPKALTEGMVSGYNKLTTANQNLTVTYTDNDANSYTKGENITTTLGVALSNTVKSIAITAPSKTEYKHGESIATNGTITVTFADNTTQTRPMTASMITESDGSTLNMSPSSYDTTNKVNKTLKITYTEGEKTENIDYEITIINTLKGIAIQGTPKTDYNVNDPLQTGLSILVTREVGEPEAIEVTSDMISNFDTTTEGTRTATITYTENGVTKTTTYEYTVTDSVKSISIQTAPKEAQKYGEELDLTGAKISVVKGSKTTTENITQSMIKPGTYDKNTLGEQTVTVVYGGKEATFKVNVKDYVTGIKVNPSSVTGKYNDELSSLISKNNIQYTVTYAKAGDTTPKALTESMVSGYNKSTTASQSLTVTYKDSDANSYTKEDSFTTTLGVALSNTVKSIAITAPSKTEYKHGESIATNGTITVTFEDNTTQTRTMTASMITESDGSTLNMSPSSYDSTNKVSKTLKITYTEDGKTENINYPITIINALKGIAIQGTPKTDYNINDPLQTGLSILVTREVGEPEAIEVTSDMISNFDTTTEGTRTATITYTENGVTKTTTYEYTVTDNVTSVVLKTLPDKTIYEYGDSINLDGATIEVTKGSGKETIPVTPSMISSYNPNKLGEQNLTVTYGGITATDTIDITVNDKVTGITLKAPTKTEYEYGEGLSLAGGTITEVMASGNEGKTVDLDSNMITSTFDSTKEGTQDVTISYKGFTDKFTVTIKDSIQGVDLQGTPKTEYTYGQEFDISNLDLIVHKSSGDKTIPVTKDMIKGYDKTKEGKQTVTIEYNGQVVSTLEVNVTNPVEKIEWITKPKTSYVIGEELDITGGQIKATKADKTSQNINLTKDMISDFDTTTKGTKTVTVTYEGQTLTYEITVVDKVNSIRIISDPKKEYLFGEELKDGGQIEATKESGEKETINITTSMLSGYNPEKLGPQTITITYGGVTTTYEVIVKDFVKSVVITPPSKVTYNYGESLDLSDAKVTKVMASTQDKPEIIKVTNSMISGYNATTVGPQKVTITYIDDKTYTQDFAVTVVDTVKEIAIKDTGFKKNYLYEENLNLSGLSIDVTYNSGKTENIPVTTGMITGYNPQKLGNQTITINYKGFTKTINVNVKDFIKDIKLTPPTKKEYKIGEALSLAGGSITEIMASGAKGNTTSLTQDMVKGFNSTTPGTKTITVTYKEFSKIFQVAVINTVNHIEVIPPTKTDYKYGESLNLAGGSIKIVMEDGTTRNIKITKDMVTGYQKTTPGQQMLTVTYTDDKGDTFLGYFSVTVGEDYIIKHQFTAPNKKEYKVFDTIDLTGGCITEVYASGKLGNKVELTNSMISGFESTTPGTKTVTVTYNGKTYTYKVTVKDEILGISIKTLPNKLEYKKGENLDVTGATLNVVKQSGATVVNITKDMVSGYDSNKEGLQVITVKYQGFTAQFSVLVEKENTTPNIPDSNNTTNKPDDKPDNKPSNNTSNRPSNTIIYVPIKTEDNQVVEEPQDVEINKEEQTNKNNNQDENRQEESKVPVIVGDTNNNQNPPSDGGEVLRDMLLLLAGLLALAGIILIIIVLAKRRRNVKIYLEEGEEKVLIGKEKVSKNNRVLDLNKYYDKYKEDEYKIVLSKSISKKLDQKTVNLIVHDKKESFVVDYQNKACSYKT